MNQQDSVQSPSKKSAKRMFAKIAGGRWYAIPTAMIESFRQVDADVVSASELPQNCDSSDCVG